MAVIGALLGCTLGGLMLASAAVAAHRARLAADLAALAAATEVQGQPSPQGPVRHERMGAARPCEVGAMVAKRNGAELLSCTPGAGESVTVRTRVVTGLDVPGLPEHAEASARAGPRERLRR